MNSTAGKRESTHRFFTVLGLILCIIFGTMLICNVTIIIKAALDPETPPSIFGITPMIVLTGSMSGDAEDHIEAGDLIFVGEADAGELKVGDIIAFTEHSRDSGSVSVITHRIIEINYSEDGSPVFITKCDANNVEDAKPTTPDRLVGIYKARIPMAGRFALFLQTPLGIVVFVGVPILLFIVYDGVRKVRYAKKERAGRNAINAELEQLRAELGEKRDNKD